MEFVDAFKIHLHNLDAGSHLYITTAVAILLIYALQSYLTSSKYLKYVPMPPGKSWIWGHQRVIFDKGVGVGFSEWVQTCGSHIYKIKAAMWRNDILVVADTTAITHIMQRRVFQYHQMDRPKIARLIGKSLAWVAEEPEHKRMRQLFAPSLTAEVVRNGAQNVLDAAENFRAHIEKTLLREDPRNDGMTISVIDWTLQATLEVIGRFGFGHDFGSGRSPDAVGILSAWHAMTAKVTATKNFEIIMLFRNIPFVDMLPIKSLRSYGDVRLSIHAAIEKELNRRNKDLSGTVHDDVPYGEDMLSQILFANRQNGLSLEELKDHVTTFVMAGSETTSQSLSFGVWELAKNPRVQALLREEVQSFPGQPTYDQIVGKMPYLDAVTRESLRLHPAVPYMEREATEDDVVPLRHPIVDADGTTHTSVTVKAGQKIMIPIITVNRLDSIWGDGSVFRPERWMEPLPAQKDAISGWSNILSFSDGPRTCVGWRLALFEFKVILAMLVYNFQLTDTGAKIHNKVASSMNPLEVGNEEAGPRLPVKISVL